MPTMIAGGNNAVLTFQNDRRCARLPKTGCVERHMNNAFVVGYFGVLHNIQQEINTENVEKESNALPILKVRCV